MDGHYSIKKMNDFFGNKPGSPIYQTEFGFYCLDKWIEQGYLKKRDDVIDYESYLKDIFRFDEPATCMIFGAGCNEAPFSPRFEVKVLEDRGDYELVQDIVGREVLYFKNRRNGFMPEYINHPVKDMYSWEKDCKWRLAPDIERIAAIKEDIDNAAKGAKDGKIVTHYIVGAYMYLRSMIGPIDLLYKFYDDPELIHDCMKTWFVIMDFITGAVQKSVN